MIDREVEVDSVRGGVDAHADWREVERLFIEARCAISNTADRGYEISADDRLEDRFRSPSREARAAARRAPSRRRGANHAVSCELTPANGDTLRRIVLAVLESWGTPEATRRWVGEDCLWVNSLVDRIVSEPLEPLGAIAEPYALWAIEDRPGLTPPCRHADVVVTNDLKRYERLKPFHP